MVGLHGNNAPARLSRRFMPRSSVTVAIHEQGDPFAYGIVTNISPSGACLVTAAPLHTGATVFLKVSFYRQTEMFETKARVVWCREDIRQTPGTGATQGLLFHGVQFADVATAQRARLLQILDSSEFQLVFSPKSGEFEALMSDISDDLNRLGAKVGQETGSSDNPTRE